MKFLLKKYFQIVNWLFIPNSNLIDFCYDFELLQENQPGSVQYWGYVRCVIYVQQPSSTRTGCVRIADSVFAWIASLPNTNVKVNTVE